MISAKDLNRCIDILAELNVNATQHDKRLILEVGYILKQELETVNAWDASQLSNRERGRQQNIDVKKLLEDNTQLFNENKKLQEINLSLKETIDQRIPRIAEMVGTVNEKFEAFEEIISKL